MTNELHQIDCNEYMKDIPDNHFDLTIVDPPYFPAATMDYFYHGGKSKFKSLATTGKNKYWTIPKNEYYIELCRISKNQIIWGINYYDFKNVSVGRIFWDKNNANSTFSDGEIASCSLIKSVRKFEYTWDGFRQGNGNNKEIRIHKTQKPVALYKWLLTNYAKPGYKLFDSHSGSGSFRIAAYDMGFDLVSCELDADYYRDNEARYQRHIQQHELFPPEEIQEKIYIDKELFND